MGGHPHPEHPHPEPARIGVRGGAWLFKRHRLTIFRQLQANNIRKCQHLASHTSLPAPFTQHTAPLTPSKNAGTYFPTSWKQRVPTETNRTDTHT